jgi:cell division protein FtsB
MAQYATFLESRSPMRRRAVGSLFCVLMLFYLAFHMVSGERGVFALLRESRRLDMLKVELAEVKSRREILEKKTQRLSSDNLDLDLLDEQAHRVLGLAGKNEVVLFAEQGEER